MPPIGGWQDEGVSEQTHRVLDLCTGNGSLAVLAAMAIAGFGTAAAGAALRARTVPHGPAMLLAAAAVTAVTG